MIDKIKISNWAKAALILIVVFYVAIIIAFIWPELVIAVFGYIIGIIKESEYIFIIIALIIPIYLGALFFVLSKIIALNASGNSRIGLLLFITFTIGKSFLLTIAAFFTAVVFIVFCMEATFVEANLMFILVIITIIVALIAFLFEKTLTFFVSRKIAKDAKGSVLLGELFNGMEYEKELRKDFSIEKVFSIFAVITTILILGDAASLVVNPIQPDNCKEIPEGQQCRDIWEVYLDSLSFKLLIPFIAFNIAYIFEMLNEGISKPKHPLADDTLNALKQKVKATEGQLQTTTDKEINLFENNLILDADVVTILHENPRLAELVIHIDKKSIGLNIAQKNKMIDGLKVKTNQLRKEETQRNTSKNVKKR